MVKYHFSLKFLLQQQFMPPFPKKKKKTVVFFLESVYFYSTTSLSTIIIKLGPTWRVNLGPNRPGGWTSPGLIKNRLWQQPGQTRVNPNETRFFFLQM
jgi:hypothetical protein